VLSHISVVMHEAMDRTGAVVTLGLRVSVWETPAARYDDAMELSVIALGGAAEALRRAGVGVAKTRVGVPQYDSAGIVQRDGVG